MILDVLRNTVIYDQSMRDLFSKNYAAERKNGLTHLQNGLNILLDNF